jgi:hypothetical protein
MAAGSTSARLEARGVNALDSSSTFKATNSGLTTLFEVKNAGKVDVRGQISAQNAYLGSAGVPAYSFHTDTNTGMYSPAADTISFATGGIEAVRINSDEQILGQYAYLGSAGVPAYSFNTDTDTGMYSPAANTISFTTGGTEAVRINSSEQILGQYAYLGSAGVPAFSFNTDTNTGMYSPAADVIAFSTGGTERSRINSTGLAVGSGTQTWQFDGTTSTLNLQSGASPTTRVSVTSAGQIGVQVGYLGSVGNPGYSFGADTNTGMYSPVADTISFSTGGVEAVRINADEQILAKYAYLGSAGLPAYSFNTDTNTGIYSGVADEIAFATGGNNRITFKSGAAAAGSGIITINTAAVTGTFAMEFLYNGVNAGEITVSSANTVSYVTSSDYRLKKDVEEMDGSLALQRIMSLRPVTFKWKSNDTEAEGFIAHELQEQFPDAVVFNKDATVDYGYITDENGTVISGEVVEPEDLETGKTWIKTETRPLYQGVDTSFVTAGIVAAMQEQERKIQLLKQIIISKGLATEEDLSDV